MNKREDEATQLVKNLSANDLQNLHLSEQGFKLLCSQKNLKN